MSSYSIDSSYTCQIVDKVRDDIWFLKKL
jgi:hypothetical protein